MDLPITVERERASERGRKEERYINQLLLVLRNFVVGGWGGQVQIVMMMMIKLLIAAQPAVSVAIQFVVVFGI